MPIERIEACTDSITFSPLNPTYRDNPAKKAEIGVDVAADGRADPPQLCTESKRIGQTVATAGRKKEALVRHFAHSFKDDS